MKRILLVSILSCFVFVLSGCHPLRLLFKEIKNYGYIPYPTPLEFSGPGTLIGGSPKHLNIIAAPTTCFPEDIEGRPTLYRKVDHTTIPKKVYKLNVSGKSKFKLFDFLQAGNPVISAGAQFSKVRTIELSMHGVHIEYLDSIEISRYYNETMPDICKEYLDVVGFIIQTMRVEKLSFKFIDQSGGRIYLDLDNINQIVDIDADASWEVSNNISLEITTPKYIGYQLGRLRKRDNGLVLYRASKVRFNKFRFTRMNIFDKKNQERGMIEFDKVDVPEYKFKELSIYDDIDRYSTYRKKRR